MNLVSVNKFMIIIDFKFLYVFYVCSIGEGGGVKIEVKLIIKGLF